MPGTLVYPTGSFPLDVQNVQAAIDGSGTIILKATNSAGQPTAFNFGPADTHNRTCANCDATWAYSGGSIVISNVVLNGLRQLSNELGCPDTCVPPAPGQPDQVNFCYTSTTITVPAAYGHYTGTVFTFEGPISGTTYKILVNCVEMDPIDPNLGMSLVQVAGGKPNTTP
jgi:hypothetical protein